MKVEKIVEEVPKAQMFHIKDFCDFCVFRGSNILVFH